MILVRGPPTANTQNTHNIDTTNTNINTDIPNDAMDTRLDGN